MDFILNNWSVSTFPYYHHRSQTYLWSLKIYSFWNENKEQLWEAGRTTGKFCTKRTTSGTHWSFQLYNSNDNRRREEEKKKPRLAKTMKKINCNRTEYDCCKLNSSERNVLQWRSTQGIFYYCNILQVYFYDESVFS